MPIPDIVLDDRDFEGILAEAKRRIPGYTPEWTDFNESDPGITLLELFSWLGEMLLYRFNRIPEKSYRKFLELVGVDLAPPAAASVELTFTLSTKNLPNAVLVPKGTRVSLADSSDGGPVIFETDDNLYAVGAELADLQTYDGGQFALQTEVNRVAGKYFYPFGPVPQETCALYLGFDRAFPVGPRHRLTIHVYTEDLIDQGQGVNADDVAPPPPAVLAWEYWNGGAWQALTVDEDGTFALSRSGVVTFEAPSDWVANKVGLLQKDEDPALYWLRYRVVQELGPGFQIAPRIEDVVINTITATNAVTVSGELVGASQGTPNQVMRVTNTPVLPGSFSLEVDEGEGFAPWTLVPDFAGSSRTDTHYVLDAATGEIQFGDGEHGKIPARLDSGAANVRAASYRWGGGARGNAGPKKITSLETSVPYVDSVTNLRPSEGGEDEESVESAKSRAPLAIKTRMRAVTADDFEFLAMQTPGARIRRAKCLPLYNPNLGVIRPPGTTDPGANVVAPGVVTVVVVPESKLARPMPDETTLTMVAKWLKGHALVTTEIYVVAPRYRRVEIEAQITAKPTADSGKVAQTLQATLLSYFHPLTGGKDGTGWQFGDTVYFADVYRLVLDTPGVLRVDADALTIFVDGTPVAKCTDIPLASDELVFSEQHSVFVSY